jgi:hypothetical protein
VRLDVNNEARLFHVLPRVSIRSDTPILYADPVAQLRDRLPRLVLDILAIGDGKIACAGGAVLGIVSRFAAPGSDYDMFVLGVTAVEATALLARILVLPGVDVVVRTGNAVTLTVAGQAFIVQIILRLNPTLGHLLLGFDLPPCGIGAVMRDGRIEVFASRSWVASARNMAFWVDELTWSESAAYRIVKYYTKGFDVVVPGVRRAMLLEQATGDMTQADGIARLYAVEHYLVDRRRRRNPAERMTLDEIKQVVFVLRNSAVCDYGVYAKAFRSLRWMVYNMVRAGIAWVRGEPARDRQGIDVLLTPDNLSELLDWMPAQPEGRMAISFNPRAAKLNEAVDLLVCSL